MRGPSDLPGIVGGVWRLRHKSWARYLALAVSALALPNFRLGLGIGARSFWIPLQQEKEKLSGLCC